MTYKEIMERIKFHRERIDELSDRLDNTENFDVKKAIINEMMWRADEIARLDTCNKNRIMTNLRKKIEEIFKQLQLDNTENFDVKEAIIKEMMWRAYEIAKEES